MGYNAITLGIWAACNIQQPAYFADPYWDSVSLLLHGEDFTDSSSYSRIINSNSGTTINSSYKKFGSNSLSFNSSTTNIRYATASEFKMDSSDFTIEFFVYPSSLSSNGNIVSNGEYAATSIPNYRVELQTTGKIRFLFGNAFNSYGTIIGDIISTSAVSTSVWSHVAIVKRNTNYTIFINGALDTTTSYATAPSDTTSIGLILGYNTVINSFIGYLDDLRITKGVARYAANFIPPTMPYPNKTQSQYVYPTYDPYFNQVALLVNSDNGVNDISKNANTLSARGTPGISSTTVAYGQKALSFPGSVGNYYYVSSSSIAISATDDFTLDAWIYRSGNYSSDSAIFDFRDSISTGSTFFIDGPTNCLAVWNANTSTKSGATGTVIALNKWYHVALVRSSGTTTCYLNGTSQWSTTNAMFNSSSNLGIGGCNIYFSAGLPYGTSPFMGYIDDYRITRYIARYTANFNPPTAPVYDPSSGDPYLNYVACLVNGNTLSDSSPLDLTVTNSGAVVNTSTFKYGSGSLYFNGSSYAQVASSSSLAVFSGNFTLEAWINVPSTTVHPIMQLDNGVDNRLTFSVYQGNLIGYYAASSSDFDIFLSGAFTEINQWAHVALTFNNGTWYLFKNGALVATSTITSKPSGNMRLTIGANVPTGTDYMTGYVDDLRITNGIARYTDTFVPPSKGLPTVSGSIPYQSSVALITATNGSDSDYGSTAIVDFTKKHTITNSGLIIDKDEIPFVGAWSIYNDGSAKYASIPVSSDLYLSSDFTIDFNHKTPSNLSQTTTYIFSNRNSTTYNSYAVVFDLITLTYFLYFWSNSGVVILSLNSNSVELGSWNHVRFVAKGNTVYSFINGILGPSMNFSGTRNNATTYPSYIGYNYGNATRYLQGWLSNLMIANYAHPIVNFTPPTNNYIL